MRRWNCYWASGRDRTRADGSGRFSRAAGYVVVAGLTCAPAAMAGDVVAFNASVRVEVDAGGKPVAIDAPADLPEAIAAAIEKRVAGWLYVPAHRDGEPVPAVTYVSVGACALPAQGGYRLGVDFKGNGPRIHSDTGQLPSPPYPSALVRRAIGGTFMVRYSVQTDGSTQLENIQSIGEPLQRRHRLAFESALKDWIERLRYDPEQVGGQAVVTNISFPIMYMVDEGREARGWREQYAAELQERAIQSDECKLAAGVSTGPVPLAIDSPIKVTPSG